MNYVKNLTKISAAIALLGFGTAFADQTGTLSLSASVGQKADIMLPSNSHSLSSYDAGAGVISSLSGFCFYSNSVGSTVNFTAKPTVDDGSQADAKSFYLVNGANNKIAYGLSVIDMQGKEYPIAPKSAVKIMGSNQYKCGGTPAGALVFTIPGAQTVTTGTYSGSLTFYVDPL